MIQKTNHLQKLGAFLLAGALTVAATACSRGQEDRVETAVATASAEPSITPEPVPAATPFVQPSAEAEPSPLANEPTEGPTASPEPAATPSAKPSSSPPTASVPSSSTPSVQPTSTPAESVMPATAKPTPTAVATPVLTPTPQPAPSAAAPPSAAASPRPTATGKPGTSATPSPVPSPSPTSDPVVGDIAAKLADELELPPMKAVEKDQIPSFYEGIETDKMLEEYLFKQSKMMLSASEYSVIKLRSEDDYAAAEAAFRFRAETIMKSFEHYVEDQYELASQYQIIRSGPYVLFSISDQQEQMASLFYSFFIEDGKALK
ncbi:DUF4358 domain-containing protein [Paenibacillus sp. PL2-23]|uniref:DUF4358 domain-containing protein n=1 Tax=Paenibacillus sp. PL2-23 TaxID=2100729 RepID=UPI0030FC35B0